jgi:hypothetical protein
MQVEAPEPKKLVSPVAIQIIDDFYYRFGDHYYTRNGYNIMVTNKHNATLAMHLSRYPDTASVEKEQKLLQLAYGHRAVQVERSNRRLLAGLVIDIVKDVPEASQVVSYLNSLMVSDPAIYIKMLQQFTDIGIVTYDEHHGRYVLAKSNDMIICICHKFYLENPSGVTSNQHFYNEGKCRYCQTLLSAEEQVVDPTGMVDRALIAGDIIEEQDQTFMSLDVLLQIVVDELNKHLADKGWQISSSDQTDMLEALKKHTEIVIDPYGKEAATNMPKKGSGDLRAFVQLVGPIPIFKAVEKGRLEV